MPGSRGATVLDDLPDWIVVEEILIRLPPRDILRCRAVRKWWQSATSTHKFMLDHHRRQPWLPILTHIAHRKATLFSSFDAGEGRQQQQLRPLIQTSKYGMLHATCDGLLIVSHDTAHEYSICNPVTRKCAPLRTPRSEFYCRIAGFYRHQPSGEYRVLWQCCPTNHNKDGTTSYYIIGVGSDYSRYIGQGCITQPTSSPSSSLELALREGLPGSSAYPPIHHRGSLHWPLVKFHGCDGAGYIMVFNTADETFRLMCCPAQLPSQPLLLEMDGTLALCGVSNYRVIIDIWVIQNYDAETWSFKHRINLSMMDGSPYVGINVITRPRMAVLNDGGLLLQLVPRQVLRCDVDGKVLEYVKIEEDQDNSLWLTRHCLQESLIPLPLFTDMQDEVGASVEPLVFVNASYLHMDV